MRTKKSKSENAEKELFDTIAALKDSEECSRFLYDLCTPKEITDMADRWLVAKLLDEGKLSYRDIHKKTGVSVTTVGRVARFLSQENYQGYRLMLDRQKQANFMIYQELISYRIVSFYPRKPPKKTAL